MSRWAPRPRFLLAVCANLQWRDGGVFASKREAAFAAAQETGDSKVIELRASDDPQAVVGRLKRVLVIARHPHPARRLLLVGFGFMLSRNPKFNSYRQPVFSWTTDVGSVVKFSTVAEARICLEQVRPFAPDASIQVLDWRETTLAKQDTPA
jgi:hypothetical protein